MHASSKVETFTRRAAILGFAILIAVTAGCGSKDSQSVGKQVELLNVSYDPTRELYKEFNEAFAKHWQEKSGEAVVVRQSHGGSGKQARSVIDGLEADVVTLALAYDIEAIRQKAGLFPENWASRLPHNSCPYTSTIVFLVRAGNPKQIKDWDDLVKPDVAVITPHPKTSGGARWNYLAAWGYVLKKELGGLEKLDDQKAAAEIAKAQQQAREFLVKLFRNVPKLDTGARDATNTFVQREMGDALLAWENEAMLSLKQFGKDKYEIVVPSVSILAEPSVTLVDKVADKHGTRAIAQAYLEYLYSPVGQDLAARHYYRPSVPESAAKHEKAFTRLELFTIERVFGGWAKAQKEHFDDGGLFDQILDEAKKAGS